jgi:hypothetical protein
MRLFPFLTAVLLPLSLPAAITITGTTDRTKYDASVTFTVTADPNAVTTTATLDGLTTSVGNAVLVNSFGYHELKAESRNGTGGLVDSRLVRFIVRDPSRGDSEDGIPPFTPLRTVNDAPSAFAGNTLKIIAPATWPADLPIPMAAKVLAGSGETRRLNGIVGFGGFPQTTLQLRRGWGSIVAPAATAAGIIEVEATVNGISHNPSITIEAAPSFTTASGAIASSATWSPNSRIHVTNTLTINAGATLTVGAGTIVKLAPGVEIVVNGTLQINGADGQPVVFTSDAEGDFWGGIEMPAATSVVNAQHAIFTGACEDTTWFSTHSGYSTHKQEQALFLISGSGSGTSIGAQLHLTDCYCFSLRGQQMNSKTNTWINFTRVLMQRAVTCGELNGSKVTIDRSALIEFPAETETFVDGDNDVIYLTNGELSISNTVLGFSKDDGVDSGANGGDNPFTAASDVTPFANANNWYEGIYHEGNSLSGTRNVTYTGCVFLNCGQGIEAGYSASSTGNGPNATADGCLLVGNMVGARWGDNYGPGYGYNATFELRNSIVLNSLYHDTWSYDWNAWTYFDATSLNSFGIPKFNVHGNKLSQPDPIHHPANTAWNSASDGPLLAPFMPVPNSNVGVAVSSYGPSQNAPGSYPGTFTVRLSTFSSRPVTVDWTLLGKLDAFSESEQVLGSGALTFAPGEIRKTVSNMVASPANYALLRVALQNPVNAEVTGDSWYFKAPPAPSPTLVARGSSGWRFRQTRTEPPATWKQYNFDDSSPSATEWLECTLPAGFDGSGGTYATTVNAGPSNDRTKAFYFRKRFNVDDPAKIETLTFRTRRDDAAVVWLNNEATPSVVSADGTFSGPYSYDATTLSSGNVPNASDSTTYRTHFIPVSKLVAGDNILAVQVHQTSITSGDLVFDCELIATFQPPLALHLSKSAGQPVLWWFGSKDLLEESPDLTTWIPVPAGLSPYSFQPSGAMRFFRLRR